MAGSYWQGSAVRGGEPCYPQPLSPTAGQLCEAVCPPSTSPSPISLWAPSNGMSTSPSLEKGTLFSFLQPLAACSGMNATPPHLRQSWQGSSRGNTVHQGSVSSGSPGLPSTTRETGSGCGYHARASQLGKSTPGRESPPEEGHQKPCSTLNDRDIQGLLAGVETSGTIYSRRGLSLGERMY